jgi:uncharacterized membrane protein YbhN (UPF0104 family)
MPKELSPHRLLRRALIVASLLGVLLLVLLLAPGLGQVRAKLADADPAWIALAVVLEALSGVSYAVMFRPVFCRRMSLRTNWELAWAELGMGSIVPASGAGGIALGAWVLRRQGMSGGHIARRSVAFLLIKSSVNFIAVAVIGTAMALGVGPHQSVWLTAVPAALAALVLVAVAAMPRIGVGRDPGPDAARISRWSHTVRHTLIGGVREAGELIRRRDIAIIAGAFGYWLFDNAVLWATFHAVGVVPPLTVILMAYLIGQVGGLLPLPGGIGGIDGGLIGTFVVYGAPAAAAVSAVLAYRVILFWLPLLIGGVCFASLLRGLKRADRQDLCAPETTNRGLQAA